MKIGFAGMSHLGIVTSAATAAKGFDVVIYGTPAMISEPGLPELLAVNQSRIKPITNPGALKDCDLVVVSLDVSTDIGNHSDLTGLRQLIAQLPPVATLVILSQVPPGFTRSLKLPNVYYQVETLIFGRAVERALHPERYMIGCANPSAPLPDSYAKWLQAFDCPILPMRYESAELAKISINMFLVSSVATTNTLAEVCEAIGADWNEIAPALRLDKRIGQHAYLSPGLGIAGGNLERDLITVRTLAEQHGTDASIVTAWLANSRYRRDWVLRKLHEHIGEPIAVWGLAYKQDTASTKNSPALALLELLKGFRVQTYDPAVKGTATSALEACADAAVLVVMTPWKEFSSYSAAQLAGKMKGRVVIDPFAMLDGQQLTADGFMYHRVGGE